MQQGQGNYAQVLNVTQLYSTPEGALALTLMIKHFEQCCCATLVNVGINGQPGGTQGPRPI